MHHKRLVLIAAVMCVLVAVSGRAQESKNSPATIAQEIEKLKQTIVDLEKRLAAQENTKQTGTPVGQPSPSAEAQGEVKTKIEDLEKRVAAAEVHQAQDRVKFTGDYRFEMHSIWGNVPSHFDGMSLQNLVVKTMFATPILGRSPQSIAEINNTVSANYANYLQFTDNLTFSQLKQAMGSFPPEMQQQLFGMLMPATYTPAYANNNSVLYTNRLRLKLDAKVADNVSFTGRLSMYKVFGDSTGVQVFNGQSNSFNIDGTTTGVPNSDQLRVDRAYFSWNEIGGSKLRPAAIDFRTADELPPGRAAGGHPFGRSDRLSVRWNHRWL